MTSHCVPSAEPTLSQALVFQGFKTICVQVNALAGDVMAGAGDAAGLAQDVCHQPPGTTMEQTITQWSRQLASMHKILGSTLLQTAS